MTTRAWIVLGVAAACTRHNPDVCNSDADCMMNDPAKPFCDADDERASGELSYDPTRATSACTLSTNAVRW
jgi:hypothetical protein